MSSDLRGRARIGRWCRATRVLAVLGVLAVVLLGGASVAGAHVSLVASDPQNVSSVPGPLDEVRLTFSAPADAVENEFSVVSASGEEVGIERVANDGDDVLVVSLAEPLPAGRTRLTWAIRSGDSHTMTGTLSFTVTEAAAPDAGSGSTVADVVAPAEPGAQVEPTASVEGATPARTLADHLATMARWIVYAAAFVCIGGLAYLGFVHRGSAAECRRLVFYVRRAALVVLVAAAAEWLFQVVAYSRGSVWTVLSPDAWADLLGTGFARGTALRMVGAALVLAFARNEVDRWDAEADRSGDPLGRLLDGPLAPAGGVAVATAEASAPALARSRVEASAGAVLGAVLLVVSEAFIGHTATVTPRLVVLLSDAGHLVAAAAWSSGALMLAVTLAGRRRRGRPLDARLLATRFSVMATWCLALVAVSGVVLAWTILDGPGALLGTEFGRILLVKLVGVAALVGAGAYNHVVLVPAIERGGRGVEQRFTTAISVEVGLFAAVLAVTALLVVSSPT